MSRHTIPALHDRFTVVVGWDNPLHTFFTQVARKPPGRRIALWLGGTPDEIQTPESLRTPLAPYATLSNEMIQQLRADRAAYTDRPPTQLQQTTLNALRRFK